MSIKYLSIISLFLFFSCKHQIINSDETPISTVDSIYFETKDDFVHIIYFNSLYFAGINSSLNKVYLFQKSGKIKKIIDQQGDGPSQYKKISKFGMTQSGDIIILDDGKALFFPLESKTPKVCSFFQKDILPLPSNLQLYTDQNESYYFSSSSMKYSPSQKSYFESVHSYSRFSFKDCVFENLAGYPENSIYRNKKVITAFEPQIFCAPEENKVYQIFPYEKNIFIYTLDGRFLQSLPIEPDQFGQTTYKNEKTMDNIMYMFQRNSRFRNIIVGKNFITLLYLKGLDNDDISESLVGYNATGKSKRKHFISFYDKNGTKLGKDLSGSFIENLIGFDENDYLWYQKKDNNDAVVVCKAKINF